MVTFSKVRWEEVREERAWVGISLPQSTALSRWKLFHAICGLTFSEWMSLVVKVTENVKLISFAREWRAHWELHGTQHLRGVRRVAGRKRWEGVVGKSATETLHWPSCKSVKDFLALSSGNSRNKWKYVEMYNTHGPVTWISILLTGVNAGEFCFGLWKSAKLRRGSNILCYSFKAI